MTRLAVESDLEELRRQVAEKEQELAELNAKTEKATAIVQEVGSFHILPSHGIFFGFSPLLTQYF